MDAKERTRLRALCEAATPGPWRAEGGDVLASNGGARVTEYVATIDWPMDEDGDPYASDAALIAASRTAIPALLDDLDAVERERDEALAELARLCEACPSAIVLRPVDPMTARGLPCACDEWGPGHLDGCPNGDAEPVDAPVPFDDEDLALADGDRRALDVVTRERDEARAELARLREPRPSAIVLQPVDPMLLCGLPCACDEWGTGHLDGCPNGDESTDGRDA